LVGQWADHWIGATRREGHQLPWARRASLAASFAHALLDGVALSARRSLGRPGAVVLTGTAFASAAVARAAVERFRAAGLSPTFPADVPILDGSVPIGQARLAGGPLRRAPRKR
jgi:hydrogenase maturation factor HypF (carbamoyltransferase family)